jgi:hypothetical protein
MDSHLIHNSPPTSRTLSPLTPPPHQTNVDVLGVVVSVGPPGTVKRKADNSELPRRWVGTGEQGRPGSWMESGEGRAARALINAGCRLVCTIRTRPSVQPTGTHHKTTVNQPPQGRHPRRRQRPQRGGHALERQRQQRAAQRLRGAAAAGGGVCGCWWLLGACRRVLMGAGASWWAVNYTLHALHGKHNVPTNPTSKTKPNQPPRSPLSASATTTAAPPLAACAAC